MDPEHTAISPASEQGRSTTVRPRSAITRIDLADGLSPGMRLGSMLGRALQDRQVRQHQFTQLGLTGSQVQIYDHKSVFMVD